MASHQLVLLGNDGFGLSIGDTSNSCSTSIAEAARQVVALTDIDAILDDEFDDRRQSRPSIGQVNDVNLFIGLITGTSIRTPNGDRAIETLKVGDLVTTMDHGPQPIRWIGRRKAAATNKAAPVVIKAGALDNTADLCVSQHNRMLLRDWRAELLFGESEVLVPANSLVNHDTIYIRECGMVEYFHILFHSHEIVFAENAPSESFLPGPVGLATLDGATQAEVLSLFPELATTDFAPSRAILRPSEAALLA